MTEIWECDCHREPFLHHFSFPGNYTVYCLFSHFSFCIFERMDFREKILQQVFGFTDQTETGAPREIIPQTGDQFTVIDQWMDLGTSGKATDIVPVDGETLTFGDDMFRWEEIYAAAGMYVVGYIVDDLDGNAYPGYAQIRAE